MNRLEHRLADYRLHHVQLQLTGFGGHGLSGIVADNFEADWLTTSGTTGLTFAGMIEEPACSSGRLISLRPARRTGREQAQVVTDLGKFHRQAFQRAVNHNVRSAVRGGFNQIFRRDDR